MSRAIHIIDYKQHSLSESERKQQTQMMMQLFAHWTLTSKQQAIILGLSPNTATGIYKYKSGEQYLPLYRDIQDRIGHLFAIHKYLRQAYPANKELAYRWMTTANADFENLTPFNVIAREGYLGLVRVRAYLELNLLS